MNCPKDHYCRPPRLPSIRIVQNSGLLAGQAAIITGGAKGMGAAITLALARAGADVFICGRDTAALAPVVEEARKLGRRGIAIGCDVTKPDQVEAMVAQVRQETGERIDILVNVAGIPGPMETPVWDVEPTAFDQVMAVNVAGTFLPIKYVSPAMVARKSGRIIAIGSNSGTAGYIRRVGYCASKWAVRGLIRTVALELGPHNVTANCINPGIVEGPRMELLCRTKAQAQGVDEATIRRQYTAAQAIARVTTAEDVANAVLFLAGETGRNITGQDIDVDGGWNI